MRLLVQHQSSYRYPEPAALGPQLLRLRPANHARARVESYGLRVEQPGEIRWQLDPSGNHVARLTFKDGVRIDRLDVLVELAVDIRPINPFDFYLDDRAREVPFGYPREMEKDLAPFLETGDPSFATGPLFEAFLAGVTREGATVPLVSELCLAVNQRVRYVIREESGIFTPEETLAESRGSCRDSAVLLIAVLRRLGLAARFVSGYLIQLTDEGMIPDAPKGVGRDVVDLHAWTEVYLPGAGWVGLDATSGLFCGEGHIPLACVAHPPFAAPLEGTSDVVADEVSFSMSVGRLGHEPRPTAPYEEAVWQELLAAGDRAGEALAAGGLTLTMGGEPTFNSRDHASLPEWNGDALGPDKRKAGQRLAEELLRRLSPGGVLLERTGKHYPGESLPRWALDVVGLRSGERLWSPEGGERREGAAFELGRALAERLGVTEGIHEAFEDPWRFLQDEQSLPVGADPTRAEMSDPEERRRVARILGQGATEAVGLVIPLARPTAGGAWTTDQWVFRRGKLFLLPGDGPLGLRLPLRSLGEGAPVTIDEPAYEDPDPRTEEGQRAVRRSLPPAAPRARGIRTALAVEDRGGELRVFLPPLARAEDFVDLVWIIDEARRSLGLRVQLEGYPPPSSPEVARFAVTPDPGVLEVNLPPSRSLREYERLVRTSFDAALHAGLHAEKYLVDGRMGGSGGGNHLTLGGPTALESPFVRRPDLLASFVAFTQHHPSLSYLFTGLFVGPTSQAPRVDEARHDALYELEIAMRRAFDGRGDEKDGPPPPPWLADALFRHLLVDVTGNTHRAEISIDKLFSPDGPAGRQGLLELRAFEMPPHPRLAVAQMLLANSIVAAMVKEPYDVELCRFGMRLHDRYLLPHFMWSDMEDVLAFLAARGLPIPPEAYRPFVELRCPLVGELQAGDVCLEVRNAIEPWNVLGEEQGASGTSRYVDSSVERVEVKVRHFSPERYQVSVNGLALPLTPTGIAGEHVAGVRFRAWAPPHSLHPHLGIHHPLRFEVVDRWAKRSLGAAGYHVWHPEGRAFDTPPLTRFEAAARRAQRFTLEPASPYPVAPKAIAMHPDAPCTLDLRRHAVDRPMPAPTE